MAAASSNSLQEEADASADVTGASSDVSEDVLPDGVLLAVWDAEEDATTDTGSDVAVDTESDADGSLGPLWVPLVPEELLAPSRVPLRNAVAATLAGDGGFIAVRPEGAWRIMTLAEKLACFVERIVMGRDRDGAMSDSHLTTRGDLSASRPWDSDNNGGWTCQ